MIKLSIIVPMYNCEKTIERCIDSILNQSFQNFELIIVNDGSTDHSEKNAGNTLDRIREFRYIQRSMAG